MGTYIYPTRGIFEDLFCIFCWWDMLVPWKVRGHRLENPIDLLGLLNART